MMVDSDNCVVCRQEKTVKYYGASHTPTRARELKIKPTSVYCAGCGIQYTAKSIGLLDADFPIAHYHS